MSRVRSRLPIASGYRYGSTVVVGNGYAETMTESSYPGSCNVVHFKHTKYANISGTATDGTSVAWYNAPGITKDPPPYKPDWNKLPSSSQFGLIQFFAEFDDTLALFTKKFWSELSYGSFTWGVLPFVSEVKALLTTISNLDVDLSNFAFEDEQTGSIAVNEMDGPDKHVGALEYKHHFTGKLNLTGATSAAQVWLDRLGFHPDLATAWDLIPLSFVVDWLLPVGDYLESFVGRGWVDSCFLDGWYTVKCTYNGTRTASSFWRNYSDTTAYEYFRRTYVSQPCPISVPPPKFEFTLPSLRELFNMAYLSGAFRGVVR